MVFRDNNLGGEVIVVEKDLDNYPCPTEEELIVFLNSFEFLDKYRMCFELMMVTGARSKEAIKARLQEFDKDFTIWKYRIQKPKISMVHDKNIRKNTTLITYKVRTVQLPEWYSKKLRQYFHENKYSMDRGYIFYNRNHSSPHISTGQLRNILVKKRRKLDLGRVWKVALRENADPIEYKVLGCHSFRRFYVSSMYLQFEQFGVDNALIKVGKLLGHDKPLSTTSLYLSPRAALKNGDLVLNCDFLNKI